MIVTDGIGQTPCSFQHYLVYINFWLPKIGRFPLTLIVALTMVLRTNVPHCDSRQPICYHLSLRHTYGSGQSKGLKLGSYNFHLMVAPSLQFLHNKFHTEILTGSRAETSNKGGWENQAIF